VREVLQPTGIGLAVGGVAEEKAEELRRRKSSRTKAGE
jgi:hypothetical protein